MSPVSGKNSRRVLVQAFRLNAAWNRQRIWNESSCGAHINILLMLVARCWGEILNWILYPAFWELGELYIVWIFISPPRYAPVSSPSVLFLAFLRSEPSAVCCGSHLHTCHEKTAVVRHNIISAAEREGKACIAVPPSVYSPLEFNPRASVQRTNIFTIETCKSCPPQCALASTTCNKIAAKPVGDQGC